MEKTVRMTVQTVKMVPYVTKEMVIVQKGVIEGGYPLFVMKVSSNLV